MDMPAPQQPHFQKTGENTLWLAGVARKNRATPLLLERDRLLVEFLVKQSSDAAHQWSATLTSGFGRETRFPVSGSLIMRTLFQTMRPA